MESAVATAHAPEYVQEHDRSKFGMWLFLASEIMFFTGFIGVYLVMRMANPAVSDASRHELNWKLAAINTMALICSSLTMALAVAASKKGNKQRLCLFLILTILLGATFMCIKFVEYRAKFTHHFTEEEAVKILPQYSMLKQSAREEDHQRAEAMLQEGIGPKTNIFFASYFTMTGFHGLHVLGGIVALLFLLVMAARGKFTAERNAGVEMTGLYWHFVDVVWIFLFPILYLI